MFLPRILWGSICLVIGTWLLVIKPDLLSFVPKIISHTGPSYYDLLPPQPKKLSIAYQLGQYEQQLTKFELLHDTKNINDTLLKATKLLNRNPRYPLKPKQLHDTLESIIKYENKKSTIGRIFGVFSFVNIMWTLSIIGISVTIIPVIYLVGKPIWVPLLLFFQEYLLKTLQFLQKIFAHRYAFICYELIGYFICWYFIYLNYDSYNNDVGFYMTFTGVMLWHPMLWVSAFLQDIRWQRIRKHNYTRRYHYADVEGLLYPLFLSSLLFPLGYHYQSSIFGFLAICGIYGFSGLIFPRGWSGRMFANDRVIEQFVAVSCSFNVILIVSRFYGFDFNELDIFITPMLLMGNVVLFTLLLYHSITWRSYRYHQSDLFTQLPMIISLILAAFVGNVLNYSAMKNTAYVYGTIYILWKICEFDVVWRTIVNLNGVALTFTIFIASIIGWRVAMFLHKNPQIIVGMFEF